MAGSRRPRPKSYVIARLTGGQWRRSMWGFRTPQDARRAIERLGLDWVHYRISGSGRVIGYYTRENGKLVRVDARTGEPIRTRSRTRR
jgi:hypothetical protein